MITSRPPRRSRHPACLRRGRDGWARSISIAALDCPRYGMERHGRAWFASVKILLFLLFRAHPPLHATTKQVHGKVVYAALGGGDPRQR